MLTIMLCVTTLDGSQINLTVANSTVFEFRTLYGTLHVPCANLRECKLGVHPADVAKCEELVKNLGSEDYQVRDRASQTLKVNVRDAQHFLVKATADANPERAKRAILLLKTLQVPEPISDTLTTTDGTITAYLIDKTVSGESSCFGKLIVPVAFIKSLRVYKLSGRVTIAPDGAWHSAGYLTNGSLSIKATGECNMWSSVTGTYTCSADGMQDGTMHEGYPAGALIGRVQGRTFLVGKEFTAANMGVGELELQVVVTGWAGGGAPTGTYEVLVK